MLTQLLQRAGHQAQCLPLESPEAMVAKIADEKPEIVCISALPPFAIPAVRALYARMRNQNLHQKTLVGLWHFTGDATKLDQRMGLKEGSRAVTTLAAMLQGVEETSELPEPVAAQQTS